MAIQYSFRQEGDVLLATDAGFDENRADAEFWETVTRNRGVQVRVFYNIDDARAWLGLNQSLPPEQDTMEKA